MANHTVEKLHKLAVTMHCNGEEKLDGGDVGLVALAGELDPLEGAH